MKSLRLVVLALFLAVPLRASAVDLIMNGGTMTLGGVNNYGVVSLTNGAKITVPAYDGTASTGNLVIHATTITIDASSSIIAKGSGYQGKLCGDGPGPAAFPASGGRGGCSLRDSGGGGAHFGNGGRGTKDNPASYPAGYEENCGNSLNAGGTACTTSSVAGGPDDCRNGDGLPTVAGQAYVHSIWATEFGAAGGDKGCRDGDGFVDGGYGPKVLTAGAGGGRIVIAATVSADNSGVLTMNGLIRADGNRGCGHGNDSAGGGGGGSVLLVGDTVNIGATAVVSAKGGRGGDEQPKCNTCTVATQATDCQAGQTCVSGRCSPCNCTPCTSNAQCNATLGQTCQKLPGVFGTNSGTSKVCADSSMLCTPFDVTDNEDECIGNQNAGTCDDCGGGGGGGIINVLSRTRTISVSATFNVSGANGGICPVCTGEAGGGAGELQIDGAYVGEICDGFDNDFDGTNDNGFANSTCGVGLCSNPISTCTSGSPPICAPAGGPDASCQCPRGTSRPRIALLLDSSGSMLQNLAGTVTFGDGSADHPGIDTNDDLKANDSKLFLAKDAVSQLIAAYPEIDFALSRYHQDESTNRSCQTAKWLECQSICCSYDNPNNEITTSATSCALTLPKQTTGNINLTVHEDSTQASRCINYAGTCGSPRRGADILVGFESDVRQYMSWLDGGETGFNPASTPGSYCGGLTGDCELRGSGPTPIAESLRALYDYMTPLKACDQAASCRDYSVIFVSDGAEECGGDPVTAAGELLAKNIKTYVIGVSVNATQATNLQAIAVAGGTANYIPVNSPTQLLPALVTIVSASIRTELCNGVDDNCNGLVDEGYNVGAACDNGLKGICKGTGVLKCNPADSKSTICNITTPGKTATTEICNDLDDNCNGVVDEGNPGGGGVCGSSTGTCKPGVLKCQGGVLACTGQTGGHPEVCDGDDNDCNGIVDDCVTGVVGSCDGAACGSSVGECKPGIFKCMGASGYVCVGGTSGTAETCNGKDDDCNGAVDDNVPGTGVPCTTDSTGATLCKPGTVRCIGGALVCQGGVAFHPPSCSCTPDDCSITNDGGTTADGCPMGSACIGCECRTPCAAGEFPCSGTTVCRAGFCVPPDCGGKLCQSYEDCVGDQCVDKCLSITCNQGLVCQKGMCVSNDCYGLGCMSGQICAGGSCVADPCANVTCTGDTFCRGGTCVSSCQNVYCTGTQKCVDGACADDPCRNTCTSIQTCDPTTGNCIDEDCSPPCGTGRMCVGTTCVDDPCANITCPGDPTLVHCEAGQCVPNSPVPAPSPPDQVVAAGGGGFSCEVAASVPARNAPVWSLGMIFVVLFIRRRRRA